MKSDKFLKCVVDDNRRQILRFLNNNTYCVQDIADHLHLEQSLVSHHLHMLKNCGLVTSEHKGKKILYRVSNSEITELLEKIDSVSTLIQDHGDCH